MNPNLSSQPGPWVLMLCTSYPRHSKDDASIFLGRLTDALSESGIVGAVVVPRDSAEPLTDRRGKFSIARFRYGIFRKGSLAFGSGIMPNLRRNPLLIFQALPLLVAMFSTAAPLTRSCSIIHAQWLPSAVVAWALSIVSGKPFGVTLLGEDARLLSLPVIRIFFSFVLRRAAFITSVNEEFLQSLEGSTGVHAQRTHCISTGVSIPDSTPEDRSRLLARLGFNSDMKFMLCIARVVRLKGIHHVLRLTSSPALADFKLLVAGGLDDAAYLQELRNQATTLGIADRVHFLGRVAPEDVPTLLQGAEAFISASSYEGRPNAVMEALAAKTLVVVSDIPAHRALVADSKSGLLFDPSKPEQAAERLADTLRQKDRRSAIVEAGHASMRGNSWEMCARRFFELYRETLKDSSRKI